MNIPDYSSGYAYFVGGSRNGWKQWVALRPSIAVSDPVYDVFTPSSGDFAPKAISRNTQYNLFEFHGPSSKHYIYVVEGITVDHAVSIIFDTFEATGRPIPSASTSQSIANLLHKANETHKDLPWIEGAAEK